MIYFYTIGDRSTGSSRYRVWNLADLLKRANNTKSSVRVVKTLRHVFVLRVDRVTSFLELMIRAIEPRTLFYVHKVVAPPELVLLFVFIARFLRKPVIFDFDDEVYGRWAHLLIRHATHVVVSSHELMHYVEKYRKDVTLIPTTIPRWVYESGNVHTNDKPVIGWIGSAKSHIANLRWLAPILSILRKEGANFEFKLVGALEIEEAHRLFKGETLVDRLDWAREEATVRALSDMSIGIMPLLDTPRFRAKASFKLIQYMALGIPVVASPVGENRVLIQDGVNGLLAETEEEWVEALTKLLGDSKLRERLGRKGQETIYKSYTLESQLVAYQDLFRRFGLSGGDSHNARQSKV